MSISWSFTLFTGKRECAGESNFEQFLQMNAFKRMFVVGCLWFDADDGLLLIYRMLGIHFNGDMCVIMDKTCQKYDLECNQFLIQWQNIPYSEDLIGRYFDHQD